MTGILDFGDIQYSYYAFELAIAMTYMMLMTGDPRAGGIVLAGYSVNRRVPDEEYRLLKVRYIRQKFIISHRLTSSLESNKHPCQKESLSLTHSYISSPITPILQRIKNEQVDKKSFLKLYQFTLVSLY